MRIGGNDMKKASMVCPLILSLAVGVTLGGEIVNAENNNSTQSEEVSERVDDKEVSIHDKEITIQQGELRLLFPTKLPKNYSLVLEDKNDKIGELKEELFIAKKTGKVIVEILDNQEVVDKISIIVENDKEDKFKKLESTWREIVSGFDSFDKDDKQMVDIQKTKDEEVDTLWKEMHKEDDRTFLWDEFSGDTSDVITKTYKNIFKLAEAASFSQSEFYANPELIRDIKNSMEFMYDTRYNEKMEIDGNWWDYEIGAPRAVNDILTVLSGTFSQEEKMKYTEPIEHFVPDVNYCRSTQGDLKNEATGANQIDMSKVKIFSGVHRKDAQMITDAKDALSKIFVTVEEGDGFYKDGSFVQHTSIPYTGSYGNVLITGLSQLVTLLQDTDFEVTDPKLDNVYTWIKDSFEPILYKGSLMDMTRGRAVSRELLQDHLASAEVIRAVVQYGYYLGGDKGTEFKEFAKQWLTSDTYYDYLADTKNYRDLKLAKEILDDKKINTPEATQLLKNYANMDRVVYRNAEKDYSLGFSLHSTRIQNYEDMNDENRHAWFTGDGMLYLYNGDLGHYSGNYWPTVNPYHMPGTTALTTKREDGSGLTTSTKDFVGASKLDEYYSSVAMDFENWDKTLSAKKSWFIFDDKVIALGADISTDSKDDVETTIENRKITDLKQSDILVDGKKISDKKGNLSKVTSVMLDTSDSSTSIGYIFPEKANLNYSVSTREGSWKEINYGQPEDKVSNDFFELWENHTQDKTTNYSYILYPNVSSKELEKASKNSQIEILENSKDVQAVEDKENKVIGINNWGTDKASVKNLEVMSPASVTLKTEKNGFKLAISDPSMKNDEGISIMLKEKKLSVKDLPKSVKLDEREEGTLITLDTKGMKGESIVLDLKQGNEKQVSKNSMIKYIVGGIVLVGLGGAVALKKRK